MLLQDLVRKNIWNLKPYSSARDEFKGEASVYLDANENPYNDPYNRYPDPLQWEVKKKIAAIKGVQPGNIMLGNGSDEPIDLVMRIFCEPRLDNVVTLDPTYGMYKVAARTNDVEIREVVLDEQYDFTADRLLKATDGHTKVVILCSPNNPSGNSLNRGEVVNMLEQFPGIVVIDEAYIDFSSQASFLKELDRYPNLIVLQTFSKAWGSAGIRLGMAFASEEIIRLFNKVKYPYNVNRLTQEFALNLLRDYGAIEAQVAVLLKERELLRQQLSQLPVVEKIYPSDANFLLVRVKDANATYQYLVDKGIIVRNRHTVTLCDNCIRITVGKAEENRVLIEALRGLK